MTTTLWDWYLEILSLSSDQAKKMFTRFYPGISEELANQFCDALLALKVPVSAAQIQGFFMFYKGSPQDAIENVFRFIPK